MYTHSLHIHYFKSNMHGLQKPTLPGVTAVAQKMSQSLKRRFHDSLATDFDEVASTFFNSVYRSLLMAKEFLSELKPISEGEMESESTQETIGKLDKQ